MRLAQGLKEDGVVIGNTYDKYGSQNPIAKRLVAGFDRALLSLVEKAEPKSIHEVGCGEGYWTIRLWERAYNVRGTDFSSDVIRMAKVNAREHGAPEDAFAVASIYDLSSKDEADLVICCEVMEHLERPREAMEILRQIAGRHVILSVPREPVWRMLNLARGKYLRELGNTPGHIQHWSRSAFLQLVSEYFQIEEVRSPLPWTMVLARPA